jgi:hypothetical protein
VLHYCQMTEPEFSFHSKTRYATQEYNRVRSANIHEGEIYMAFSQLDPKKSKFEAVAFPVRLESVAFPQTDLTANPFATIAMRMILLDQDFQRAKVSSPSGLIENGNWSLRQPIEIQESTQPIYEGYFVLSLPDDPSVKRAQTDGKQDPHSIGY